MSNEIYSEINNNLSSSIQQVKEKMDIFFLDPNNKKIVLGLFGWIQWFAYEQEIQRTKKNATRELKKFKTTIV